MQNVYLAEELPVDLEVLLEGLDLLLMRLQ